MFSSCGAATTTTGKSAADEADIIFALNDACPIQDPAWADCFVSKTITDYIVDQAKPEGYLTADNVFLAVLDRVSKDGRVETKTELETGWSVSSTRPAGRRRALSQFALDQVKHAVIHGAGPLAVGKDARAPAS